MTVTKRTVSLAPDIASRVIAAADEEGVSFSAWLAAAAEHALLLRDGLRAVGDWEAENGAFTPEELAAAEAAVTELLHQ